MYLTPRAHPFVVTPGAPAQVSNTLLLQATEAPPADMAGAEVEVSVGEETFEGTASLDAATGTATIELSAVFTATLSPGQVGSVRFLFELSSGAVVATRRMLRVASQAIYPTVTAAELIEDYPDLSGALRASTEALRKDLGEAWEKLNDDMYRYGLDPNLVFDPRALARPHKMLAATLRYRKFGASNGDADARAEADRLHEAYRAILQSGLVVDSNHDGDPDTAIKAASPFHDIMRPYFPRSG